MERMTVTLDIQANNIGQKPVNLRSSLVVANLIATIKDKFNLDGNYVLRLEHDRYELPEDVPLDQTAARGNRPATSASRSELSTPAMKRRSSEPEAWS